jgi:hypothetical protein
MKYNLNCGLLLNAIWFLVVLSMIVGAYLNEVLVLRRFFVTHSYMAVVIFFSVIVVVVLERKTFRMKLYSLLFLTITTVIFVLCFDNYINPFG